MADNINKRSTSKFLQTFLELEKIRTPEIRLEYNRFEHPDALDQFILDTPQNLLVRGTWRPKNMKLELLVFS